MQTYAIGKDGAGSTKQITVGDVWESMINNRLHAEIISFDGQNFEVLVTDFTNGSCNRGRICDFDTFVSNWRIFSYGTPLHIKAPSAIESIPFKVEIKLGPKCECGAHKIGVKDYAKGHSNWCKVFQG